MSGVRTEVAEKRTEMEQRRNNLTDARANVASRKRECLAHERHAEQLRAKSLAQRTELAAGGNVSVDISATDILEADTNLQAAAAALRRFEEAIPAIEAAVKAAEAQYNDAVDRYMRDEIQGPLLAEIDQYFEKIAEKCATASAAALIAHEHNGQRSRTTVTMGTVYGPAGDLVRGLERFDWPTYPVAFRPNPFRPNSGLNGNPSKLEGFAEAYESIRAELGEGR